MVRRRLNGSISTVASFLVNRERKRVFKFAGEMAYLKWTSYISAIVSDDEIVARAERSDEFSTFGILGGYVWGCLFGVGMLVWMLLSLTKGLSLESCKNTADELFRMLLKIDKDDYRIWQMKSENALLAIWSFLCLMFISCYTGGVMSITQTTIPHKVDESVERWVEKQSGSQETEPSSPQPLIQQLPNSPHRQRTFLRRAYRILQSLRPPIPRYFHSTSRPGNHQSRKIPAPPNRLPHPQPNHLQLRFLPSNQKLQFLLPDLSRSRQIPPDPKIPLGFQSISRPPRSPQQRPPNPRTQPSLPSIQLLRHRRSRIIPLLPQIRNPTIP